MEEEYKLLWGNPKRDEVLTYLTKDGKVFHPSVVDNNGKFHLLDDNDMYKVLIPTIYGLSGIKE